ncbi:hypothetical protein [Phytohabitans rumicis]
MTIDQLHRHLSTAAEDDLAPPTRVTASAVYLAGRRRRTRICWSAGAAAVTTLALASAGVATLVTGQSGGHLAGGSEDFTPADPSCRTVAETVRDAAASVLPDGIQWEAPRLNEGTADQPCDTGGLFWLPFEYQGRDGELGFEGGTGMTERGCDPERKPAKCQEIEGGEIGHLNNSEEYGVLYSRDGVFFFLGLSRGQGEPTLTTDQLADAARVVATVFSTP